MKDNSIRQVIILVGGRGTRLGEIARDVPKPLVPIADERPFLDYLLKMVARHGYQDIVLLAGHLGERVEALYEGKRIGAATVRVMRETEPLGTGGALTNVCGLLDKRFIMMNGDALFDFNLRALEVAAPENGAMATLALRAVEDVSRYGRVIAENGRIVRFMEKDREHRGSGTINGGVYVLKRKILSLIESLPCSIEQDIFPVLAQRGDVSGVTFEGYFLDIGIPEALERGHRELPLTLRRPAAFLDRDGVLNLDEGYTFRPESLRFVPGAIEAVRRLNDAGYYVIVVSNQAGVARGYFSLGDAERFNREMQAQLIRHGAHIDQFYICPYHPDGMVSEYAMDHPDRKPNPGMLLRALDDWPIERAGSFLIGDKQSDVEAAARAGIKGYLFEAGDLDDFMRSTLDVTGRNSIEADGPRSIGSA